MTTPRWYMVTHDGAATLCVDEADAQEEAKKADMAWPRSGPHRAVRLVEVGSASLSANAWEPVAHLWQHCETGRTRIVMPDMIVDADASWQVVGPLYLGAAPPTAQAEGWRPISTAPKDKSNMVLLRQPCGSIANGFWLAEAYAGNGAWIWPYVHKTPTHWMPLPPPPTSAEWVEHE